MKKKMLSYFSNHSLRTQVLSVNGIVISVLLIMTFIFATYFFKNYNAMLNSQLSTILEISSDSIQNTVDDIEETSINFMTDDDIQNWIKIFSQGKTYSYDHFVASNELKKAVLNLANEQSETKFTVLLDNKCEIIVSAMGLNSSWTEAKSGIIKENMKDGEKYKWIAPTGDINDLVMVRAIADLSNPELPVEGYLVIGIDIQALATKKDSTLDAYPLNTLVMFDDDVLYTDFENKHDAKAFMRIITSDTNLKKETEFKGERYFCTYKEMSTPGWKYAVYVPHEALLGRLENIMLSGVAVFIAIAVLIFYISYKATNRMVKPLSDLSKQMKKVENGVFEGVKIRNISAKNEIDSLAVDFNVMVKQIDTLIHEDFLKKILLQESELKLLQSQINPHFLYNTLESVNWMAKGGRMKEISVMVQALSNLFRSTVNNKESVITLREELNLLGNYITIQKLRFEERLEIYIDVEEEYYNYKIPKLILQPIVENSIKYALERYKTACIINIYAERTVDGIGLYIKDNGPGIEKERLELIKQNKPIESKSGIALKNIRRRMELAFHNENAMEIESEEGTGTTIILKIKKDI